MLVDSVILLSLVNAIQLISSSMEIKRNVMYIGASQLAIIEKTNKAATPAAAKNINKKKSDEANVTTSHTTTPRCLKPPPVFVQNKDRWTELRQKCVEKNKHFSQLPNSFKGLKLHGKTVADFRNLQNIRITQGYAFRTNSLKEEREIKVVHRRVSKEIPVEEIKEDLRSRNFPVQSVGHILNRYREPFELVLISSTVETNDKATKAAFYKIKSVCSLSGIKAEQLRTCALTEQ
ncbi:hypothetical protein EVAR_8781_1 [Eumeta japonica]|uniref:Pre-C2HC domain-containing protein n=1 Tax=Eumeta variegata TaxID=151549 RepID=A0A4C1TTS4_EUMVA|nr:hypothetical protein EVAR_8781_1 [Eumeta japonica]